MAKRGNGEGSIYYRNSIGKWVGSVTLGTGKRKVFYGKISTLRRGYYKYAVFYHVSQRICQSGSMRM